MRKKTELSEDHLKEVRRRVLNSTKTLLVQYGYKRTTIRMIVEKSGVLIGSIYYIFKNKEDIFQSLILEMVQHGIAKIEERCPDETPAFRLAAICELELKEMEAAPIIRDVYKEGYDSNIVFEHMVSQFVLLAHHIFDGTELEATEAEYYERMLLIKGAMRACIAELYFEQTHDHVRSRAELMALALNLFHVPSLAVHQIIARIEEKEELWLAIANDLAMRPIGE
ncbi:TetR/AcrR family transcriptional regulator [Selenomonas caprae]|uniref:TetR/AcrR family transcriptional regulator n=1 Tax=Selenomonas caprae TaxID=2606905 RepID=A0A5D6WET4_9FIRM|nr:TetR/AcrR family transcriptional regulator [Selenomonas caprae]TYZ26613.1 TetR/AcrR family transcriptional regulator [Selenomonas caprae]